MKIWTFDTASPEHTPVHGSGVCAFCMQALPSSG